MSYKVAFRARIHTWWHSSEQIEPGFQADIKRRLAVSAVPVVLIFGFLGLRSVDINMPDLPDFQASTNEQSQGRGGVEYEYASMDPIIDPTGTPIDNSSRERVLSELAVGEYAYTTSWGMWLDDEGNYWLHPQYTAEPSVFGTVKMLVEHREDGYHVFPPSDEYYEPQAKPGYMSPEDTEYITVAEVHQP